MTYTYDDIVTAKDILTGKVKEEDIIGKSGWFSDCLFKPEEPIDECYSTLKEVDTSDPLTFKDDDNVPWQYFLPEKEKSYEERQAEWVKENNLKVGDRVRIVKEWNGFEKGNKPTVGETGRIESINTISVGVRLDSDNGWWWYGLDAVELIEDEPAYIPFDLSDPKDRDALRDKWVKAKLTGIEARVIGFGAVEVILIDRGYITDELLKDFTFLDGSPVGRPANGQQIRRKHGR